MSTIFKINALQKLIGVDEHTLQQVETALCISGEDRDTQRLLMTFEEYHDQAERQARETIDDFIEGLQREMDTATPHVRRNLKQRIDVLFDLKLKFGRED